MKVVLVVGGIATGKSAVGHLLASLGAWRIDADDVSREVCAAGTPCLEELAQAFGQDILTFDGTLDRALLAQRAFASEEDLAQLEAIEMPYIVASLMQKITFTCCAATLPAVCAVEVPLLDRAEELLPLADEVLYVHVPYELRRERAAARGVSAQAFEARAAHQPSEEYLRAHATYVLENAAGLEELGAAVKAFWQERLC
jgi:dephospho-CoA kinase